MSSTDVAATIRRIITSSGLTQAEFARRLGVSAPRLSTYANGKTLPSAALLLHMYRVAREATTDGRGWPTAAQTAAQIDGALERGEDDWAYRLLLEARDRLGTLSDADRSVWARQTPSIGDRRWLTLMQAVVLTTWQHAWGTPPSWAAPRPLAAPWSPLPRIRSERHDGVRAPELFTQVGIDLLERDLATA